ncbi:MAG: hypothetical protein HYV63_15100 [Candidatus Schekmanbacteria bacterium]|nr:hypothetical protein [Candidatus Schekmanbacteria bacterium]
MKQRLVPRKRAGSPRLRCLPAMLALGVALAGGCAHRGAGPEQVGLSPLIIEFRGIDIQVHPIGGAAPYADVVARLGVENPNDIPVSFERLMLRTGGESLVTLERTVENVGRAIGAGDHVLVDVAFAARLPAGIVPSSVPPFSVYGIAFFQTAQGSFSQQFTQHDPGQRE